MTYEDKDEYFNLKDKYDLFGRILMSFTHYVRMFNKEVIPSLPLIDKVKGNKQVIQRIPYEILIETGYKDFLEKCFKFGEKAIFEYNKLRDKYKK